LVTGALGVAIGSMLMVGQAAAAPTNAKKGETLELQCTGGVSGTIEIATNGNGQWTPGIVISGSHQTLIPYAFHFAFTPPGGPTFTDDIAKPQPKNGRYAVCTFGPLSEPDGTVSGTVWVTYTPAH
jgi:hypothetical protein